MTKQNYIDLINADITETQAKIDLNKETLVNRNNDLKSYTDGINGLNTEIAKIETEQVKLADKMTKYQELLAIIDANVAE